MALEKEVHGQCPAFSQQEVEKNVQERQNILSFIYKN